MTSKYHKSFTPALRAGDGPRYLPHAVGLMSAAGYAVLALWPVTLMRFGVIMGCEILLWAALLLMAHRHPGILTPHGVWLWALVLRGVGGLGPPLFEDDYFRYLWDGYRLVTAGNPYTYAPEHFFTDTTVPAVMQGVLSGINHPELPTIYGPTLQYLFGLAYVIAPGMLWPLKLLFIAADVALLALLMRRASLLGASAYAFCPLVILEIAFTAHPDGLGAALLFAALCAALSKRRMLSAGALACACAVKPFAWPFVPWVLGRAPWAWAVFAVALVLLYAPFLGSGGELTAWLAFARGFEFNAPLYALLSSWLGNAAARALLLACFVAGWLIWLARAPREYLPRGDILFGLLLLCAPAVNPWYLLWLLPFAAVYPTRTAWTAAAALLLAYFTPLNMGDTGAPPYRLAGWVLALEYSVIAAAWAWDLRARRGGAAQT